MLKKITNKNKPVSRVRTSLKKGDTVVLLSGKDKGKTGIVLKINRKTSTVLVEGLNQVKKAKKRVSETDAGGILTMESPIDISNVMFHKNGVNSKLKSEVRDSKKVRVAKKNGEVV